MGAPKKPESVKITLSLTLELIDGVWLDASTAKQLTNAELITLVEDNLLDYVDSAKKNATWKILRANF